MFTVTEGSRSLSRSNSSGLGGDINPALHVQGSAAPGRLCVTPDHKRTITAAPLKNTMMGREIANEFEMPGKSRILEHHPSVAADRKYLASLNDVVVIEAEFNWRVRNCALVDHGLTIILARRFQRRNLEQSVGGRDELSGATRCSRSRFSIVSGRCTTRRGSPNPVARDIDRKSFQ